MLIVDHRVPMWDRDSGSLRMQGMIEALLRLRLPVTFLPDDRHFVDPYTLELQRMGVEVWYGDINIHAELLALGPELAAIFLCPPAYHQPHGSTCSERSRQPAAVIYDTVDLHWLRESRRDASAPRKSPMARKAAALREIELALIRATDATLVVTEEERDLSPADVQAPGSSVWVAPNVNAAR